MNLSQLQAETARLLGDKNNDRWPLDVLTTRINLAQTEIQGLTSAVKAQDILDQVANTETVTVDSSVLNIIRVIAMDSSGNSQVLRGITLEQLDYLYPNWRQYENGTPMFWWYDASNIRIHLVPKPAQTILSGLTVWEARAPVDLVNPTDIPFNGNIIPYHMSIVHWVVAQCFQDDGTPEALAKARFHKSGNMLNPGEFEKQIGRIMAEFDVPEAIPGSIMWKPQGGRLGYNYWPQKSYPFLY